MSTPHTLSHWYHGTPQEDIVLVRNMGPNPVGSCILNASDIRRDTMGYVTRDTLGRFPQLVLVTGEALPVAASVASSAAPVVAAPDAPPPAVDEDAAGFDVGQFSAKEARQIIHAAESAEDLLPWVHDPRASVRKALEDRTAELGG